MGAVGTGFGMIGRYQNRPGTAGNPPEIWPRASLVPPPTSLPVLLLVAHPRCPCTRASLGELAHIVTRCKDLARFHVLFLRPLDRPASWVETDLWRTASSLPGVVVSRDDGGRAAGLFHASTSGQALLYGVDGRLLWSGGITGGRGHPGNNAGRAAVIALLTGEGSVSATHRVYGCPLRGPNGASTEGSVACEAR